MKSNYVSPNMNVIKIDMGFGFEEWEEVSTGGRLDQIYRNNAQNKFDHKFLDEEYMCIHHQPTLVDRDRRTMEIIWYLKTGVENKSDQLKIGINQIYETREYFTFYGRFARKLYKFLERIAVMGNKLKLWNLEWLDKEMFGEWESDEVYDKDETMLHIGRQREKLLDILENYEKEGKIAPFVKDVELVI